MSFIAIASGVTSSFFSLGVGRKACLPSMGPLANYRTHVPIIGGRALWANSGSGVGRNEEGLRPQTAVPESGRRRRPGCYSTLPCLASWSPAQRLFHGQGAPVRPLHGHGV